MAQEVNFDPLCRPSAPDRGEGLFVELLEYIAAKERWHIRYTAGTLPECMERLGQGEIDLVPAAAYSQENEGRFYFARETVISTWAQVYSLDRSRPQSLIQLDKRTVGVVRDDPYNQELRRIIKGFDIQTAIVEFDSSGKVFHALKEKWIDAGVADRLYGVLPEAPAGVKSTPVIFSPVELRFVASREGRRDLIDTLDYHLARLKNDPDSPYYRMVNQILGEKKNTGISVSRV